MEHLLTSAPSFSREKAKKSKKCAGPFSEILDPPLVLVVADGRGAGLGGGGGGVGFGVFKNSLNP